MSMERHDRHVVGVRADGSARLDRVLALAVAPAIEALSPPAWAFVRHVGADGVELRVGIGGPADAAGFRAAVVERLPAALAAPAWEPLLPTPAAHRATNGWAVEPLPDDTELPWGADEQAQSVAAVALLQHADDARDRLAGLLAALRAVPAARRAAWRARALGQAGSDDRADRLRERVAERVAAWRDDLDERAAALDRLGERGPVALLGAALAHADDAHALCVRCGIAPLDELALALLVAGAGDDASTHPAGAGAGTADADGHGTGADGDAHADGDRRPAASEPDEVDEDAALTFRDVVLERDGTALLDGLSVSVRRGQVLGVLGDAAARTAVLDVATGRATPTAGTTHVAEAPDDDAPTATPEADDALSAGLTVRANVALLSGAPPGAVEDALGQAGLQDEADRETRTLAAAAVRRTAIACALARRPTVLVLDDPSRGLSAPDRETVWAIVQRRHRRGGTTLLATPSASEAVALCDRVVHLEDGAATVDRPEPVVEARWPVRALHLRYAEDPDRPLLADIPEVDELEVEVRPDHWIVRLQTREPERLRALLEADPDVPAAVSSDVFAADEPPAPPSPPDPSQQEATPA
jgi:ABC-type multidrug transport system ATPase subunit